MEVIDNFSSSFTKFLDARQKWNSLEELKANTSVLMPNGFQVYCVEENQWFQLSCSDEKDTSTYSWSSSEGILQFIGTQEEWDNLTLEEKAKYDGKEVIFTNDGKENEYEYSISTSKTSFSEIGAWKNPYDLSIQGTFAKGDRLYQYLASSTTDFGHFEIFDFKTGTRVGKTEDIQCYHGNDFTVVGDDVYCAPFNTNVTGARYNKIIKFTLGSTSVTEIDAFEDTSLTCLYAITTLDDDTLLCALRDERDNVDSTVFYKYSISSGTKQLVEMDWGDWDYSVNYFPHPMVYTQGYVWLSAAFDTGLYKIRLNGNKAEVVSYYALNNKNNYNYPLNELEGVCQVERFGKNYLVVTYSSFPTTIMFEGICINGVGANSLISDTTINNIDWIILRLDYSNPDTFFEDGSEAYPFKMFERCMFATQNGSIYATGKNATMSVPNVIDEGRNLRMDSTNVGISIHGEGYTLTFKDDVNFTRSKIYTPYTLVFEKDAIFGSACDLRVGGRITVNGTKTISPSAYIVTGDTKITGTMDLLLTRDSYSDVGALTLDIDFSLYKYVAVKFAFSGNPNNGYLPLSIGKIGEKVRVQSVYGACLAYRSFTTTPNGISFTTAELYNQYGNVDSVAEQQGMILPVEIYGIR